MSDEHLRNLERAAANDAAAAFVLVLEQDRRGLRLTPLEELATVLNLVRLKKFISEFSELQDLIFRHTRRTNASFVEMSAALRALVERPIIDPVVADALVADALIAETWESPRERARRKTHENVRRVPPRRI